MKRSLFILFFVVFSLAGIKAQNINGFWKGTLTMAGGCFPINNIELQITNSGTKITGDSYHYMDIDNYVKKNFEGSYSAEERKIVIQEEEVTTRRDC